MATRRTSICRMKIILQKVLKNQGILGKKIDSKIAKLKVELKASIDENIGNIKGEFHLELGKLRTDLEKVYVRMAAIERHGVQRDSSEPNAASDTGRNHVSGNEHQMEPTNNTDITIIAIGFPELRNDDLLARVESMIDELEPDSVDERKVKVQTCVRIPSKINNRPGLVKIAFFDNIRVLRRKSKLK